jgi:hypothetical protein
MNNASSLTRDQIVAMSLDDLLSFWSEDVKIDYNNSNLDQHILNVGVLHSKYLKIMVIQNDLLREAERARKKVVAIRTAYYTGKISREEEQKYGWTPYQHILSGKQLSDTLETDAIVSAGNGRVDFHTDMVEACKLIIKEIGNRSYQLKAALDWQKIRDGYST